MYGKHRLLTIAALLFDLWILGITGYVIIEGWNVLIWGFRSGTNYIIRGGDIVVAWGSREGLNALREPGMDTFAS